MTILQDTDGSIEMAGRVGCAVDPASLSVLKPFHIQRSLDDKPEAGLLPIAYREKDENGFPVLTGLVKVTTQVTKDDIWHGRSYRESEYANPVALALNGKTSHHWRVEYDRITAYSGIGGENLFRYYTPVSLWHWMLAHHEHLAAGRKSNCCPFELVLWMPESEAPHAN